MEREQEILNRHYEQMVDKLREASFSYSHPSTANGQRHLRIVIPAAFDRERGRKTIQRMANQVIQALRPAAKEGIQRFMEAVQNDPGAWTESSEPVRTRNIQIEQETTLHPKDAVVTLRFFRGEP